MNLFTQVKAGADGLTISLKDRIVLLGSCFSDNIGERLVRGGFDCLVNPFGPLYNPASIAAAIERLDSGSPFTQADCVPMGAGAGLTCSHSHHTSFARPTAAEFLDNANRSLADAREKWLAADKVILTLGTAFVWRLAGSGRIVSNCLKRPACEFTHEMLSVAECANLLGHITDAHPEKEFLLTVSPIRHLSQGAHANTLSKATLHLAAEGCGARYFPAYEIVMDELRDYRFYAEDMTHPGSTAIEMLWERFLETYVPEKEHETVRRNEKEALRNLHRPITVQNR